jgi:hypothetical protein
MLDSEREAGDRPVPDRLRPGAVIYISLSFARTGR